MDDLDKFVKEAGEGTYAGLPIADLDLAFRAICNRENWKFAFDAVIPESRLAVCSAATVLYAGCLLHPVETLPDGMVKVHADGYYASVGP